jgi:hypothetical protein
VNGLACRVVASACWLGLVAAASASGCTSEPSHPPALGDCVPVDDASCAMPQGGAGSGVTPQGDAAPQEDAEAGSCSIASTYFQPANGECLPCIESKTCMALLACTSSVACQRLLLCAQDPCDAGSATCLAQCEANWPSGVSAYVDLANTISSNCSPECPMLPVDASQSDL